MATGTIKSLIKEVQDAHTSLLTWDSYGGTGSAEDITLLADLVLREMIVIQVGPNGRYSASFFPTAFSTDEMCSIWTPGGEAIIQFIDKNTLRINSPSGYPVRKVVQLHALKV